MARRLSFRLLDPQNGVSQCNDGPGLSYPMKNQLTAIRTSFMIACVASTVFVTVANGAERKPAPTRLATEPGTPALIAAGTNAEALARAALNKAPSTNDAAANPTSAEPGANPPWNVDGNFLVGPVYVEAPELRAVP